MPNEAIVNFTSRGMFVTADPGTGAGSRVTDALARNASESSVVVKTSIVFIVVFSFRVPVTCLGESMPLV